MNQPLYQSGTMIAGRLPKFATNGLVQDAGNLLGDANGRGVSPFAITDSGLGLAFRSAAYGSAHNSFQIGFDGSGNTLLQLDANGGAAAKTIYLKKNGTLYEFPFSLTGIAGPVSSTAGRLAAWDNASGTLLADKGNATGAVTLYANSGSVELLNITNKILAPVGGPVPSLRIVTAGIGDNATFIGVAGAFIVTGDDAGTINGSNKGVLYGIAVSLQPKIGRNNSPFDDATGICIQNDSPAPGYIATDGLYFGIGAQFASAATAQWAVAVKIACSAGYALQATGTYGVGLDFGLPTAVATLTTAVLRGPNQTPLVVGRNVANNADIEAIRINASDGVTIRNGPTIDSTGLIIATNGIVPNVDNAVSNGSGAKRWQNVYSANFLNGAGVMINNTGDIFIGSLGTSALATNATGPFLHLTACAGTPTGVPPQATDGRLPLVFDTAANKLWAYHGSWKGVVLS